MRVAFGALATLTVLASGCGEPNTFVAPPPPKVVVQAPTTRTMTPVYEFTGRIEAVETVEIRARVTGFLETIEFEPGLPVPKDKVLFTIERDSFEASLSSAQAELAQATAARDLALVTLEKAKRAFEQEAVTELEVDQRQAELDAAAAAVQAAEAKVATAALELSYTTIRAPVAGRVSRDLVSIGNLVGSGEATLLTTIVVDERVHVYFRVDERQLIEYVGQRGSRQRDDREPTPLPARLMLVDGNEYAYEGEVNFGETRLDPMSGSLEVRAEFPNPDGLLFPGQFARISVPKKPFEATLVPEVAVGRDQVGAYLLVVGPENVVQRRDVALGERFGRQRAITEGVETSDRVVVEGVQRARPGIEIEPIVAPPAVEETEEQAS